MAIMLLHPFDNSENRKKIIGTFSKYSWLEPPAMSNLLLGPLYHFYKQNF